MSWFLQIGDSPPRLFATYGLTRLKRRLASQRAGRFSFTADGALCDSDPLAVEGTHCAILWERIPFFQGRLHQIPRKGSGSAESVDYELLDAWHDFERNVYQQQWNVIISADESGNPTTAAQYRGECILGMDLNGNALTNGEVIRQIIAWAISLGANCQLGVIGVNAPVPFDEVTDLPCSECIKKMLRWTPDAVTWIDYTTTPPTFNVTRRGDCAAASIPFIGNVEEIDIKALPELVPPSVVIRYLQENQTDGVPAINVIPDVCPENATGMEYGALVQSTRLAGTNSTYQKQPVTTAPIPPALASEEGGDGWAGPDVVQWFRRHSSFLAQFSADRLEVLSGTFSGVVMDGTQIPAGNSDTAFGDYPNELTGGSNLPNWVLASYSLKAARVTVSAAFAYQYPDEEDAESILAMRFFGPDDGALTGWDNNLQIQATVPATNAVTQTYAQLTSYTQAEPVPAGLAGQLYDALSTLQYEGQYTTEGSEVTAWRLGAVLNLAGGRPEWAAMNALLQEIVDDLDAGRTTLKFGPAGHLTLQDLMEQLRANRTRTTSSHIKERQSGTPGDAPEVDGPGLAPFIDSSIPTTTNGYPWIDFIDDQDNDDGSPATFEALLGYGDSDFAGVDAVDHSGPIEKFEISVGNDGSGWTGPDHDASDLTNVFSVISGDGAYSNDRLWLGAMDSSGNGGSVLIKPGDPSIHLSPNLDPAGDTDNDQSIDISLPLGFIQLTDGAGNYLYLNDEPIVRLTDSTGGSAELVSDSLTFDDGMGGSGGIDIGSVSVSDSDSGGKVIISAVDARGASVSLITVNISGANYIILGAPAPP